MERFNQLIERIDECKAKMSEAARKGELDMYMFWLNASLGFCKKAHRLIERSL